MAIVLGAAVLVASTGGAPAATAQQTRDRLVCSPDSNGGHLVRGVCVLPRANVGQQYEGFIITSNNSGGTFRITSGSLPAGLSMPSFYGASGTIVGGTPTTEGTYTFTVGGTDGEGQPLLQTYSIKVDPPLPLIVSSGACCAAAAVQTPYDVNVFSHGGAPPMVWSIPSGLLPVGLSLCPSPPATISGVPTASGTFDFTVRVIDSRGSQASETASITVSRSSTVPDSLSVSPTCVKAGVLATGTIRLGKPAPPGGKVVSPISSSNGAATQPSSLTVPAGAVRATFPVTTHALSTDPNAFATVTIQAWIDGNPHFAYLTVRNS